MLSLFADIFGSIAEKRYPAVRKAGRLFWTVFLFVLVLYVGYAWLAA